EAPTAIVTHLSHLLLRLVNLPELSGDLDMPPLDPDFAVRIPGVWSPIGIQALKPFHQLQRNRWYRFPLLQMVPSLGERFQISVPYRRRSFPSSSGRPRCSRRNTRTESASSGRAFNLRIDWLWVGDPLDDLLGLLVQLLHPAG